MAMGLSLLCSLTLHSVLPHARERDCDPARSAVVSVLCEGGGNKPLVSILNRRNLSEKRAKCVCVCVCVCVVGGWGEGEGRNPPIGALAATDH